MIEWKESLVVVYEGDGIVRRALVTGAGGFIGGHMANYLKSKGYFVKGVDVKPDNEHLNLRVDRYEIRDLRTNKACAMAIKGDFDEVYHFAANMGGMGFICGNNDVRIMDDNTRININMLDVFSRFCRGSSRFLFASSACVYPVSLQSGMDIPYLEEGMAYPANPDSEYGWEKLYAERLVQTYKRCLGCNTYIARYHNIYGSQGTYDGGREKAPAAICRKIAMAKDGDKIDIWGDGDQVRSFCYITNCVLGTHALMLSDYHDPVNIGSNYAISINVLADMIIGISGKNIIVNHVKGPQGVRTRCCNNSLAEEVLNWVPGVDLYDGLKFTYTWIKEQVAQGEKR